MTPHPVALRLRSFVSESFFDNAALLRAAEEAHFIEYFYCFGDNGQAQLALPRRLPRFGKPLTRAMRNFAHANAPPGVTFHLGTRPVARRPVSRDGTPRSRPASIHINNVARACSLMEAVFQLSLRRRVAVEGFWGLVAMMVLPDPVPMRYWTSQ